MDGISKQKDIQALFKSGKYIRGKFISVRYLITDRGGTRAIFPLSRKFGGAVERNRARRRLKEALGKIKGLLPANIDIAVFPGQRAGEASFEELRSDMEKIFG